MSITTRRLDGAMARAALLAHNRAIRAITENLATYPHADATARTATDGTVTIVSITTAEATNPATTIALANACKIVWNEHLADGGAATNSYGGAHKAADTANVVSTAAATDQTTANTLLNALKSAFNLHVSQAGVHFTNDGTYTVSAADATDEGSSQTLATQIKARINSHIAFALGVGDATVKVVTG